MTPSELETVLNTVLANQSAVSIFDVLSLLVAVCALYIAYTQLKKIAIQIAQTSDQLEQAKDAMILDHERSRRERTLDIIKYYQEGTKPEHNKIIHFLDRLTENDLLDLRDGKPLEVSGSQKEIACSILLAKFPDVYERYCGCDGKNTSAPTSLSHAEVMHLRFFMLDIINHYETCLVPWQLGIVDNETIETQFATLVDMKDGKYKLEAVRKVFGVEKFPATEAFKEHLFAPRSVSKKPDLAPAK